MSQLRLAEYLDQMDQAARSACDYVDGMTVEGFLEDKRTQQAVILNLVIIGEAATRLLQRYGRFVDQQPQVPWVSMKGMRNRIAHGYFDINLEVVWETVRAALPELLTQLPSIRSEAEMWIEGG